jgi:hypothetical protein
MNERGMSMASSKGYLDFILEQLSDLDDISYRAMMGEYIIYYRGKVVGGIYDDRFLVKPTKSAVSMMPDAGICKNGKQSRLTTLLGRLGKRRRRNRKAKH